MKFEHLEVNSERWFDLTPLLNEEFKSIEGYENFYQISNYGRVKSLKRKYLLGKNIINVNEKILKPSPNTYNYLCTTLSNKKYKKQICLHIEVAKAFIDNGYNKPTVNHKDGNNLNNCVDNLEWATYSEQLKHAFKLGLREMPYGNKNTMYGKKGKLHHRSKPVCQYDKQGVMIKEWECTYEIVRKLGFTQAGINRCCLGKIKTYKGYVWKYKEKNYGKDIS